MNKYIRIAAAVLAVIWMFRIYSFSSDDADESTQVSRSVCFDMVQSFNDVFHMDWDYERIDRLSRNIEKTVRKTAHIAEFAVLGALVGTACDAWRYVGVSRRYVRGAVALFICSAYAFTDELHQTFVEGRSGELGDAGIDILGSFAALMVIGFAVYIHRRRRCK